MPLFRPLPDPVHLHCPRCGRFGRYRLERYQEITEGADPHTALQIFAERMQCPLALQPYPEWDKRCGIVYGAPEAQKEPPPP